MSDKWGRPTFEDGMDIAVKASALGNAAKRNELNDVKLREIEANNANKEYKNQAIRILQEQDNGDTYNSDINARMESAIPIDVMQDAQKEYVDFKTKQQRNELIDAKLREIEKQNRIDDYSLGFINTIKQDGINSVGNIDFRAYGSKGKEAYQGYLKALQFVNTEMEAQNGFTDKRMKSAAAGYDQLQKGIYGISNGNQPENVKKTALINLVNNSNTPYRASVNENKTIDLYYNEYSNINEPKIVADDISFEDAVKRVGSIGFTEYASMHGASMQAAAQNNLKASPITFKNSNGDTMTAYKRTNPENVNEFQLVTFDKDGSYSGETSLDVLNKSGWRKVDVDAEMKTKKAEADIDKTKAETRQKDAVTAIYEKNGSKAAPKAGKPASERLAKLYKDVRTITGVDLSEDEVVEYILSKNAPNQIKAQYLSIIDPMLKANTEKHADPVPDKETNSKETKKPESSEIKKIIDSGKVESPAKTAISIRGGIVDPDQNLSVSDFGWIKSKDGNWHIGRK